MALAARYCSQCAARIERRTVEGRPRDTCPACGTVFYENPLPVAACLVLNDKREVLLVRRRREPYQGMWCLPIGFAETGETIGQAARRELKEEAGIDGRILRLIDVDSAESGHYGDLLIVTFELERVGGRERAGDDAEDVAYFPLDAHPPLAFESNEKAVRFCALAHEDEWAITDSFARLQGGDAGQPSVDRQWSSGQMLSDALVTLVQAQAAEVTRLWLADVLSNTTTTGLRRLGAEDLHRRGYAVLSRFAQWLREGDAHEALVRICYGGGRQLRERGFALHEVISSLMLLRKHVWTYAGSEGVWERPIDVYRVLELNRRIAIFFDKVLYHTARGFAEAKHRCIQA